MTGRKQTCQHPDGWSDRGMGDDRWQECWLCGEQREAPGREQMCGCPVNVPVSGTLTTACEQGAPCSGREQAVRSWWRRWFGSPAPGGVDVGAVATRHLFRGHRGEALLCRECVEDDRG